MNFSDNDIFDTNKTLHIDGDILIYRACCIFNDDSDSHKRLIATNVENKIHDLMCEASCSSYRMFLSPKSNFRNYITDDYKSNRKDTVRPVNLGWSKRWAVEHLGGIAEFGMEADDLLGVYQDEDSVIWSPDKDLRQIEGAHLCENTGVLYDVDEVGTLEDRNGKVFFAGSVGFYYQLLIGDTADYIVGCGIRIPKIYKSGKKKGKSYHARVGVGPKDAFKFIVEAVMAVGGKRKHIIDSCKATVMREYRKVHKRDWKAHLENQGNLLYMVRELNEGVIKRWTIDGRDEYMRVKTGEIYDEDPNKG